MSRYDELAKQVGFKSASEFLDYCSTHSETERALFNGPQVGALQIMAGYEEVGHENMKYGDVWRSCDLRSLVDEARDRLAQVDRGGDD